MLIVPLEEAEPGMKLAAPVLHPEHPEQELLRRGYILESPIIGRLKAMGIVALYVDFPGLDHLDRHLAVHLSPARQAMFGQIKEAITTAQNRAAPCIAYHDYVGTVRELITTLLSQGHHPIYMDQMARLGSDAVSHATAVSHLSLLLGLKLESYLVQERKRLAPQRAKDTVSLGIAAMLHDLGASKLPEEARLGSDADPPEQESLRKEWESHAQIGYEMIREETEPTAAVAVLQHHEHFDGSGFPDLSTQAKAEDDSPGRLDGHRIHIFARIILAANLYDRLATPVRGSKRRSNVEILRLMRTTYAPWIDPEVLWALELVVPPFPPGCRLMLSDNTRAIVMDFDPRNPLRPIVRRVLDDKWTLAEESVDLRKETHLTIKGAEELETPPAVAAPAAPAEACPAPA